MADCPGWRSSGPEPARAGPVQACRRRAAAQPSAARIALRGRRRLGLKSAGSGTRSARCSAKRRCGTSLPAGRARCRRAVSPGGHSSRRHRPVPRARSGRTTRPASGAATSHRRSQAPGPRRRPRNGPNRASWPRRSDGRNGRSRTALRTPAGSVRFQHHHALQTPAPPAAGRLLRSIPSSRFAPLFPSWDTDRDTRVPGPGLPIQTSGLPVRVESFRSTSSSCPGFPIGLFPGRDITCRIGQAILVPECRKSSR